MSRNALSLRRRRLHERRARMERLRDAEPTALPSPNRTSDTDAPVSWVDLLHAEPLASVATGRLRAALRFAFESGDAGGLLSLAVDDAPVAASDFEPSDFAGGLFLPELLRECFVPSVDGQRYQPSERHLLAVLTHPPRDMADVRLRQEVLRELVERPDLRAALERAYASLHRLRSLLDEQPMTLGETARRKLEVLQTLRRFFDEVSEGLSDARSALGRLAEFAAQARAQDAYRRLTQVLDFDGHLATLQVRLVLGSDGKIRDAELLNVEENTANPLVRSPWARAWSRLRAWLRGYRFGEDEVLLKVVDAVFEDLEPFVLPCFRLIGDLEVYLSALAFRDRARAAGLEVCLAQLEPTPSIDAPAGPFAVEGLFNPLLFLQQVRPIPCDLRTAGHDAIVLITGPNSGGKTRLLQSVALAQLLGQGGLFVPARRAHLTRAPTMFVSLVEEATSDQKEGRLGTELRRVRRLFEHLRPGSLVILDELCSGTNPSEGIAIFELVVSLLPRLRPRALLTTHFLDAARKLQADGSIERLTFLQVELDAHAKPTFRFVPGVAPTSLAQQVASRLGVTREELEALVERQLERHDGNRCMNHDHGARAADTHDGGPG